MMATRENPDGDVDVFEELFRDLRSDVSTGVRLFQAKETDTDVKYTALFDELNTVLPSVEQFQRKLFQGAPR